MVLVPTTEGISREQCTAILTLNPNDLRALQALGAAAGPLRSGEWRKAVEGSGPAIPSKTFDNWRKKLVEAGYVAPTAGSRYLLTTKGNNAIGVPLAS